MARCSHRRRSPPSGVFRAILPLLAYAFFEVVPAALAFSCPPLVGLTRSRGDAFAGATTLRPPPSCLLGVTPLQHALRTASSPPGLQGPGSCSRRGGAAVWMSGGTEGADDPESCRLFVNGIAATVDADRLRTAFEPFPGLTGCTIAKPGLGSVTFSSAAATEVLPDCCRCLRPFQLSDLLPPGSFPLKRRQNCTANAGREVEISPTRVRQK